MKKIILILFLYLISFVSSEAQWYTQQSGTTNALYDIEFVNEKIGFSCGDGVILKTMNGGINWTNILNDAPIKPFSGIFPVDSNLIYAVGFFRTIVKSTNGGNNWTIIENGNIGEGDYYALYFINSITGWISLNYANGIRGVMKTTNGGNNFVISQIGFPEDLYFRDELNGIGVGGVSKIYHTSSGGINWSSNLINNTGNFYRVSFINDNTGYTASTRAAYKTTNFGETWDSVGRVTPFNFDVPSIEFANENTGWAGTQAPFYKTTNGGKDWNQQFITGVVYSIHAFDENLVWTCGNAGRIWHTTNGGLSFINNISNELPKDYKLFQNYPNPFNSQTNIKFEIIKSSRYILEIFDSKGSKIEEVFSESLNPGQYELIYNAERLNSGVYFYRLSDNNFNETKKLILVK